MNGWIQYVEHLAPSYTQTILPHTHTFRLLITLTCIRYVVITVEVDECTLSDRNKLQHQMSQLNRSLPFGLFSEFDTWFRNFLSDCSLLMNLDFYFELSSQFSRQLVLPWPPPFAVVLMRTEFKNDLYVVLGPLCTVFWPDFCPR